jgi:hypothetical protein
MGVIKTASRKRDKSIAAMNRSSLLLYLEYLCPSLFESALAIE